ncbi:secreted RxLR effector protein 161-like [Lucilia cuprina]|uniref:secreted RxLR effector protein 161-like n=1 Tax=Lucilia cuprina TaxID=7375 RepID=UPI001F05A804|nr:secreted RxLR effector protein 161-like [Lucilia cuprina]
MENELVLVTVYVDDLIIGCKNKNQVLAVKHLLANEFPVTDKGVLHHFLGIEIERVNETGTISICQSQYIKDLLQEYGMENCKAVATPLETNHQVNCTGQNCKEIPQRDYQSIIGALMYLSITTRPDILHSVAKLAQRNSNPHEEHMQAVKRILRYLKGTVNMKLEYTAGETSIEGFVDADWGGDNLDRKSYTGFVFFIGNCPVSWQSKKQSCVALSSTEAEYMALSEAAKEAIYLKRILEEIGYTSDDPVMLNVDNQE